MFIFALTFNMLNQSKDLIYKTYTETGKSLSQLIKHYMLLRICFCINNNLEACGIANTEIYLIMKFILSVLGGFYQCFVIRINNKKKKTQCTDDNETGSIAGVLSIRCNSFFPYEKPTLLRMDEYNQLVQKEKTAKWLVNIPS